MKKISTYLIIFVIAFSMISCQDEKDRECNDNIKLSQKEILFDSAENSFTITTQSTYWWVQNISLNDNILDLSEFDHDAKNFVLTKNDFQIERKEDGKKIIILMKKNNTNVDLVLILFIQNGNCYDAMRVTQSK